MSLRSCQHHRTFPFHGKVCQVATDSMEDRNNDECDSAHEDHRDPRSCPPKKAPALLRLVEREKALLATNRGIPLLMLYNPTSQHTPHPPRSSHIWSDALIGRTDGGSSPSSGTIVSLTSEQPTTIVACSASNNNNNNVMNRRMNTEHRALLQTGSRQLCKDRKGVLDHLYPLPLSKSMLRVVLTQGTHVITQYLNDQLKEDLARDELVARGKLNRHKADEEADEWSDREWKRRWEEFPRRLAVAFGKFHSIILVMRLYEHIASKYVDKITLDRLTMDTFESAKRSSQSYGKSGRDLMSDVFSTCWRANLISYLADFSVHEIILLFGYYVYVQDQRRIRQKSRQLEDDDDDDDNVASGAILVYSIVKNSTLLFLSRAMGLLLSSVGGALGSLVAPAWGSLAGANLGDGLAMAVSDEIIGPHNPPSL